MINEIAAEVRLAIGSTEVLLRVKRAGQIELCDAGAELGKLLQRELDKIRGVDPMKTMEMPMPGPAKMAEVADRAAEMGKTIGEGIAQRAADAAIKENTFAAPQPAKVIKGRK